MAMLGVVGYYLLAFILTALASLVLPDGLMAQAQYTGFNANSWGGAILIVFILAVITPIFEELIFRGFLLGKLHAVGWLLAGSHNNFLIIRSGTRSGQWGAGYVCPIHDCLLSADGARALLGRAWVYIWWLT